MISASQLLHCLLSRGPSTFQEFDEDVFEFQANGSETVQELMVHRGDKSSSFKRTPNLTEDQLRQYSGDYYSEELQTTYRFLIDAGQLAFRIRSADLLHLQSLKEGAFSHADRRLKFTFHRDENNRVQRFRSNAGRITNILFVKRP
ncbi:hypothetical protein MJD09_27270 [bacterium]|nr:hypothetical protein [bacterium]